MRAALARPARPALLAQGPAVALARRPVRALALVALSRILIVGMLALPVLLHLLGRDPGAPNVVPRGPGAATDAAQAAGEGVGLADLVALLAPGGPGEPSSHRVVELSAGAARAGVSDLQLVVVSPQAGGDAVDDALEALTAADLGSLRVRSVAAVPEGLRMEVDARVVLSSARLPEVPAGGEERLATDLAVLLGAAGADLVRIDVTGRDGAPPRLVARGTRDELLAVTSGLEQGFTSPHRLAALRIVTSPDGRYEMTVTFRLRFGSAGTAGAAP